MPGTFQIPPNIVIATMTQMPETPVDSPRIFGPKIFPSNCCKSKTKIRKYKLLIGLIMNNRIRHGTAPKIGPKKGIMFVTPIIKAIKTG